jgi:NAD+ synthase
MMARTARPTFEVPAELAFDASTAIALLVDFIRRETRKAGFSRAVLGLSGGVDSAAAAALAVRALGAANVLCASLPYRTSSPDSLSDARRMVTLLGARSVRRAITPMIDAYFAGQKRASPLRRGNKMARERMAVLYDLSARERALVVGTSNKTELLLGYGTIFGDLACGINPLGDLYKTQVRGLALHLGVPRRIVFKVATADLWPGQSDEQEIGARYEELDRLLHVLVDRRVPPEEAVLLGFTRALVRRITKRISASQFKRRTPLIAKVSPRTVGIDFLYPRDWGK